MAAHHLFTNSDGESQLKPLDLPTRETPAGTVRGFNDIPTTTTGLGGFVGSRKPDSGMHTAPRRQFVIVLTGELEIVTSVGQHERMQPGDFFLADDIGSKGHLSLDVGDEPLLMMTVGIADEWEGGQA